MIENPFYKKLWEYLLFKKNIYVIPTLFHECPGGVGTVHHAYLGGLLEHSNSMIKTAKCLVGHSKEIDMGTLLTGCLIHDIGKIVAYSWDIIIEMNDKGRLLHHIPLGMMVLNRIIDDIYTTSQKPFVQLTEKEEHDLMLLHHIIVSHHEDKESVRKPMTAEAQIVSGLDNLDAAANYCADFINNKNNHEQDTNWTRYSTLTERRYYKPVLEEKIEIPEAKSKRVESDSMF